MRIKLQAKEQVLFQAGAISLCPTGPESTEETVRVLLLFIAAEERCDRWPETDRLSRR